MFSPRIAVNVSVALAIAFFIGSARAYTLGLDSSISGGTDALYALDRNGREVKIAQTGSAGPDWVVLEDIGTPSVALDGSVLFGAARMESSTSMVGLRCGTRLRRDRSCCVADFLRRRLSARPDGRSASAADF